MSAPATWTIAEVRSALGARKISARELVKDFYTRIEQRNAELNIYLALSPERAYAQADASTPPSPPATRCLRWPAFRSR